MRTKATLLAALAALLAGGGCALNPYGEETVPSLESFGVRISSGIGAADAYVDAVEVGADNTVQFEAMVGDGKTLEVTIPREPAAEIVASARLEGSDEVIGSVILRSRGSAPISVERLYAFDPGYIGVEADSTDEHLELRIATPRLTGTVQGQVPFTFKSDVTLAPG